MNDPDPDDDIAFDADEVFSALGLPEDPRRKDPFYQEAQAVSDKVHELLGGPEGTYETQHITLALPKAFVYLAEYLAIRETESQAVPSLLWQSYQRGNAVAMTTRLRNHYIARMLWEQFQDELHWLAVGGHALYSPEDEGMLNPPEEGAEASWPHKVATGLLRCAFARMANRHGPPDREECARAADRDPVSALMVAAYELAEKALEQAIETRERYKSGAGDPDDDIPF